MADTDDPRSIELKKLRTFARVNGLKVKLARAGEVYLGRLQVQTAHLITQNVGEQTLVVHDKALVGKDLRPGQALRVDYSAGVKPAIALVRPKAAKEIGR